MSFERPNLSDLRAIPQRGGAVNSRYVAACFRVSGEPVAYPFKSFDSIERWAIDQGLKAVTTGGLPLATASGKFRYIVAFDAEGPADQVYRIYS